MKRIIGVSASLRNGSNSEFLLDQFLLGAKDSFFTPLSIEVPGEDTSTEWFSPVEE